MPQRFYVETLGCPKNQVDSDKLVGTLLADGMVAAERRRPTPTSSWSTPAPSSRRPARSRSTRSSPSTTHAGPAPSSWSPAAWPSATATSWPQALPEVDAVAGFGVPVSRCGRRARRRTSVPEPRPAQPAPPAGQRRPGPTSRSPRAATAAAGSAPSPASGARSAAARSTPSSPRSTQLGAPGDRARRPGPGRLRRDEPGAGRAARSSRWCEAVAGAGRRGCGCCTSTRATSPTASIDAICATGVPYFDLSLQHVSRRCCAACAGGATATGSCAASTTSARPRARRRVPLQLHRRLPGRDRGRPRPAAALRRGGPARLVRLLRLLAGGGTYAAGLDGAVARRPGRRAARRAARAPGRASPPPGATS